MAAAQDVGWVYREPQKAQTKETLTETIPAAEEEVRATPSGITVIRPQHAKSAPIGPPVSQLSPDLAHFAVMAGIGIVGLGILATGVTSLAVLGLMTGPVLIAGRFLTPK